MKSRELRARAALARNRANGHRVLRAAALSLMAVVIAALGVRQTWASAQVVAAARAAHSETTAAMKPVLAALRQVPPTPAPKPAPGADIDGDGQSDFMNPTGRAARTHDAYGYGAFGASRDGGTRMHEGVDYVSVPDQTVLAPMSGFVTRLGYAYAGDMNLRTVEIVNPALNYVARILYVDPSVTVGQAVHLGETIGHAQSLQGKYPGGMTNHVHLQIAREGRDWMDARLLIPDSRG